MTGKKVPSDLLTVIGLVILTDLFVLMPGLSETVLRNILGLPLVLFLPGYALIAALFPAKSDLDGIERTALSFGLSIAVVPLIGLGLNYTPWGIRILPILISLSLFTFAMCGLAYLRRAGLPEADAFKVPFREMALALKAEILEKPEPGLDRALTVILVLSILLSVTTLFYVVITPKEGEHFTEFYLLGPEGMADNYPTNYTLGESGTVIVGVVNHEYRPVNYTMEVRLENKSLPLPEDMQQVALAYNETWEEPLTLTPPVEGKDMKLEFLLFNETDKNTPYRDLHLWINVNSTDS
ncbi:hypothetical protein EO98_11660 [Methanosarcina sp. 2.H.T.1A.6]|uniref:DUF1616 domain-containing protein n=1 Tax=unclassified Methanosarcina TaxID=2644672 RepID=UPI0006223FFB|nr:MULTISPECIES: DUF1616 domain-containing protein [unclassified Methanosarcina]KKG17787.1 hypothetical protein EO94_13735 [Methanosarcina sp. 2.H.T.1A.3]KKG19282.1 hypothetical protein EO98_11660 [Methanosarcina sp. 2.H.T.1A.6]KKG20815.1 hypothetical protein EO97_19735 [Methanosarcina sp. 2.H.T.1A.15]KKG25296.1 hypothetical protein EO96_13900 [Methanosarcina sp. 2.H.T.1A.8]